MMKAPPLTTTSNIPCRRTGEDTVSMVLLSLISVPVATPVLRFSVCVGLIVLDGHPNLQKRSMLSWKDCEINKHNL